MTYAESRIGEEPEQNEDVIQIRRYEKNYGLANELE
jgi:hypothetical protein